MASIINATTTAGVSVQGDNSGSLQLATNNGTTAVTIDTNQRAAFVAGTDALPAITTTGDTNTGIFFPAADTFAASTAGTERMRITSSGQLFVNNTTNLISGALDNVQITAGAPSSSIQYGMMIGGNSTTYTVNAIRFVNTYTPAVVGTITIGSSSTAYNTSSDYRLKENVAPMTGALGLVQQLKPVTYNWKSDGSSGQGFIAHELQAVVPDCVTGEKDAVDEEGNPVHQGIDTSFLVATLTAAIQELKAELDATKAEVQALKGVA